MSKSPSVGLANPVRFFFFINVFIKKKNECSARSDGFGVPLFPLLFSHFAREKPLTVCVCCLF